MANRKPNSDSRTGLFLLLAVGGAAAAYYFSKQGTSNQPLASGPALPPPGGGAPPGGGSPPGVTNAPPPASKDEPAVSGIVNDSTGKAATAKEKQQGLNWLQATILKACNKSIYNPFTASDLASNSFGPKSRAALAVAEKIMRDADAGMPRTVKRNLFGAETGGDAALQALVTAVTAPSPDVLPNAAEIQALVKAAGGAGSIGAPSPTPSPPTGASNTVVVGICPEGKLRLIRTWCNLIAYLVDSKMTFGKSKGLTVAVGSTLTGATLESFRRCLALVAEAYKPAGGVATSPDSYFNHPSLGRFPVSRLENASNYTLFYRCFDSSAEYARLDATVLQWLDAKAGGVGPSGDTAQRLEDAYDKLSTDGLWNDPSLIKLPYMAFGQRDVAEEYPGKQFVFAKS